MKRVLTAVVLVPVVLLLVFKAPLWLFALAVAAIIILALREYLGMAEAAGLKPLPWPAYVAGVLPILVSLYSNWRGHALPFESGFLFLMNWQDLLALAAIIFGIPLVFRKNLSMGLASVAASAFGVLYIGVSLSLLINLRADFDITLLVFLLCSVWAGDIAAYYVGKNFGKHKLAPVVSPNKSWEGAIASVIASVAVAVLIMRFRPQLFDLLWKIEGVSLRERTLFASFFKAINPVHAFLLGILTNVAAQFGDLFESALKRSAGVKDSGTLLPGHGGILDRIDALLFAIPVVWYYANQIGLLLKQQS
jgi:phosphatidate cytidylyltransferase